MTEDTFTVSFPITECRLCGRRDWQHVAILGAVGNYCRVGCATRAQIEVLRLNQENQRKVTEAFFFHKGPEPIRIGLTPMYDPRNDNAHRCTA